MELNHLKYFYTVVREGSFTKASQVLRIQQPTISKMVLGLEDTLGFRLLDREKKGVRLTKVGAQIFTKCEEIFNLVEDIRFITDLEKHECRGPLAFGVTDSVCAYLIPNVIAKFLKEHYKVVPSIFSGSSRDICAELLEGNVEFGIFFSRPDPSQFEAKELVDIPYELIISTAHLTNKKLHSKFIISREIDYPKSRPYPIFEMLAKNNIKIGEVIACNNLDTQKELVREGLGVSMVPRFMVKSSFQKESLAPIFPNKSFSYPLRLVYRRGKILSRNALTFIESFKESLPKLVS